MFKWRTPRYLKNVWKEHLAIWKLSGTNIFRASDDFPTLVDIKFSEKPIHTLFLKSLQKRFTMMYYVSLFNGHTLLHTSILLPNMEWTNEESPRGQIHAHTYSMIECPNMLCTHKLVRVRFTLTHLLAYLGRLTRAFPHIHFLHLNYLGE